MAIGRIYTQSELKQIAHHMGYEWGMLLGACDSSWHKTIDALNVAERAPLRVVHSHARTELVWLHARVLYGFLFNKPNGDNLSIISFLEGPALQEWNRKDGLRAVDLCREVESQCTYGGPANKKLFHATDIRLTDRNGLPPYTTARDQLQLAFKTCYRLMVGSKRDTFRAGLNDEWDVADVVLGV